MSSPATTAFLAAYRSAQRRPVTLCKIELTDPSSRTLRFASEEIHTPDGNTWEAVIKRADVLDADGAFLSTGPNIVHGRVVLLNRTLAAGGTPLSLLSDFRFQGAAVTLYLWEKSLTSFSDALQVFGGVVNRPGVDANKQEKVVNLYLMQDRSVLNKRVPTVVVDKISHPNAPDAANSVPVPVVYGDFRALAMRSPWGTSYGSKDDQEDSGAGQGVVPGVQVDIGVGGNDVKVAFASHECADILDRTNGYSAFIRGPETLSPVLPGGLTESLGASESYLTIADESIEAYAAVLPVDVRVSGSANTADNARNAMDPYDETTYALLDQGASKGILQLTLPNVGPLGYIVSAEVVVAFTGDAANTHNIRVQAYNPGSGALGSAVTAVSTGTSPTIMRGTWPTAAYPNNDWNFGGSTGAATVVDLRVDFTGGAANTARVYWAAVVVRYRPSRSLVLPGFIGFSGGLVGFPTIRLDAPYAPNAFESSVLASGSARIEQPKYKYEATFFGNLKGYKDDVSGTYTGSASALIERAPDIARHLLVTYGGAHVTNDFETGATAFGSFVLARSTLKNAQPDDYKLAVHVGQLTKVQQVLQKIAEQSLSMVVLDRFDNKFRWHVWKNGAAVDYDLDIPRRSIFAASVDYLSDVSVVNAVRMRYLYDHFKSRTLFETFVNQDRSSQGFTEPTVRDQKLTVSAGVNDKIDADAAGGGTKTLTAATYAPINLAMHIRTLLRGGQVTAEMHVGFGFHISTSGTNNNALDFKIGATPYVAALASGSHTAEGLCIEIVRAMTQAVDNGWTCTYSHSTNLFTITGTNSWAPQCDFADAVNSPNYLTSAWPVVGIYNTLGANTTQTTMANTQRYADRFWFTQETNFNLLWSSGANAATSCRTLLGINATDKTNIENQSADRVRGQRETLAAASVDDYGEQEITVTADYIRNEGVAVEYRNRLFDLRSIPPALVKFSTYVCPDMQRGRVIRFDDEMDGWLDYPGYGTDGSWGNKVFRVVSVRQHLGPQWHQEIEAVSAS